LNTIIPSQRFFCTEEGEILKEGSDETRNRFLGYKSIKSNLKRRYNNEKGIKN